MAAQLQGFLRLGGGVDHRRVAFLQELQQLRAQFLAELVVEIDQRLVEQQQGSVLGERTGEGNPLLLATGEFRRSPLEEGGQAQRLGCRGDALLEFRPPHALQTEG